MNPPSYSMTIGGGGGAPSAMPVSKVALNFSCVDLANTDLMSKSDPQIWLYTVDTSNNETLFGKTEKIMNDLNPKFATSIQVDYRFEEVQTLAIYVVDIDSSSGKLNDQDVIGSTRITLAKIVSGEGGKVALDLKKKNSQTVRGKVVIVSEELQDNKLEFALKLSARKVDKKDMFGKSDPYLVFAKQMEDGSFVNVLKTEVVKNTLNPSWKELHVSAGVLCGGDLDRKLKVTCFDWDSNSAPDVIGECCVTARELAVPGAAFPLINPKKKAKKKSYTNSGTLCVDSAVTSTSYSFLDYIMSGFKLNMAVAIDFTASNGDPQFANSLHYMNPYEPNEYAKAISSCSSVLLDYDTDKMIVAYGFGAKVNGKTEHCFPLNFNPTNPEVAGVQGLMQAYTNAVAQVKLYGPTNLAQIIQQACAISQARAGEYLVLLIITDGVISDQDKTIQQIVAASKLPISIVIVGVGGADFSEMEKLDGDDGVLKDKTGRAVERDIVQFTPFRQFAKKPMTALAASVLAEIPGQFTACMKKLGLKPIGAQ